MSSSPWHPGMAPVCFRERNHVKAWEWHNGHPRDFSPRSMYPLLGMSWRNYVSPFCSIQDVLKEKSASSFSVPVWEVLDSELSLRQSAFLYTLQLFLAAVKIIHLPDISLAWIQCQSICESWIYSSVIPLALLSVLFFLPIICTWLLLRPHWKMR